jgi:hypothetical protein
MADVIQLGRRNLQLSQVVDRLTTSQFLPQYLRAEIIDATLSDWEQSQSEKSGALVSKSIGEEERKTLLEQYKRSQWGHKIASRFLQRKAQLDSLLFSVIQVDDYAIAQELFCRIQDDTRSFSRVASIHSQGESAHIGGTIGPVPVHQLHPLFYHHLTELVPGQVSKLFQIDRTYAFVRLEKLFPARFDESMQQQLLDEMFEQWLQQQISRCIGAIEVSLLVPAPPLPVETSIIDDAAKIAPQSIDSEPPQTLIIPRKSFSLPLKEPIVEQPIVTVEETPSELIAPTTSFYLPSSESHDSPAVESVNFTLPQTLSTQLMVSQRTHRGGNFVRQIFAFLVFFCLFLGGGMSTFYLLDRLITPAKINVSN